MPSIATRPNWNSRKGKQRSENKAFVLFVYLNYSYLENLTSFSVTAAVTVPSEETLQHWRKITYKYYLKSINIINELIFVY